MPAMPSMAPVELDFLGLRPPPPAAAGAAADHHHGSTGGTTTTTTSSSIRGMKTSAIASIGTPQLLRVIIGDDEAPPKQKQQAPMTVFYNGAVATFDGVSQDKAEIIMKTAMEVTTASNGGCRVVRGDTFAANLTKDTPLTRTKSLQQFLQKRKERLSGLCPYQLGSAGTSRVGAATTTKSSFHVKEEAAA